MRHTPRLAPLLGSALVILAGGCCDLAQLLCGPDRSTWVSVSYESPDAALATFMEAVRRDATVVIVESLSNGFLERKEIPGRMAAGIGWEKLKQQITGVHLLGTAEVTGPAYVREGLFSYELERSGYRFRVDVARVAYWDVAYEFEGQIDNIGHYLDTGLSPLVQVRQDDLEAQVAVRLDGLTLPEGVTGSNLRRVVAAYEWKVDDLVPIEDAES